MNEEKQGRFLTLGRRWERIDSWYQSCLQQIYPEKSCAGHRHGMAEVIRKFVCPRLSEIKTVLDLGCGVGDAARYFKALNVVWVGVTLGQYDISICRRKGLRVFEMDFNFVDFPDDSVDLAYARHSFEHSPFPLFSLAEAARLSRKYLLLVVPRAPHFCRSNEGVHHPDHYSAGTTRDGWLYLAECAGWELLDEDFIPSQIEERLWFRKAGTNYP